MTGNGEFSVSWCIKTNVACHLKAVNWPDAQYFSQKQVMRLKVDITAGNVTACAVLS